MVIYFQVEPSNHLLNTASRQRTTHHSHTKISKDTLSLIASLGKLQSKPADSLPMDRTKRFQEENSQAEYDEFPELPEIYRDMCRSRSTFELVSSAINDALLEVEVLPNTWIWTTRCLRNDSPCPSVGQSRLLLSLKHKSDHLY